MRRLGLLAPSRHPSARDPAYRWVVLGLAFLAVFGAMGLTRFGYSAVLPDMAEALRLSSAQAGSLASWNLAAYMLMALVGGFLAARFGPRLIVSVGLLVTTIGLFLTGLANGLAAASAARFLTGLGNGMVFAPSLALLVAWFHGPRLGFASTLVSSATGLALVVAGPAVPRLLSAAGGSWRVAWFFFAGIALLMCALTATLQRDGPGDGPTIAAAATEKRVSLSDLRLVLRSRYAWHLGLIYLLYGFAYIIYLTFFQKRLISDLGLSPNSAGDLFLLAGVSSIILGTLGGTISDRFGRGRALALVLALQAVAACLFGLRLGAAALVVSAVLFGAGVFTVAGLVGAACGDKFGTRLAFPSLGFVTVFIGLGQTLGPYLGGSLADRFASLGPAYLMCAAVSAAAAVAALFLPDFRR